ncbi:hypothetical protein P7K49_027560 [Saguinus oedipus]|uniref:Uncharacterized protein n=1 Tax=Saguinus oedipus TaxID=9490 RepID=A0ABQ9U9U5_SAGOE|nr:hypothetical protein P7K49_027560 [Saguinus oedipus]
MVSNRRMKHKRQMQDSQLNSPVSGSLHVPSTFHSPSSGLANGLQVLSPWAPLRGGGPGSDAALWLFMGSLPSGTRGLGLCVGFLLRAASGVPPPQAQEVACRRWDQPCPWGPGACVCHQRQVIHIEEGPLTPCLPPTLSVQIGSGAYLQDSAVLSTSWWDLSP